MRRLALGTDASTDALFADGAAAVAVVLTDDAILSLLVLGLVLVDMDMD